MTDWDDMHGDDDGEPGFFVGLLWAFSLTLFLAIGAAFLYRIFGR